MPAKTPLAGDNIDALAVCAVPFRPYCGGVVMRMRNVSEYMLVLALCIVENSDNVHTDAPVLSVSEWLLTQFDLYNGHKIIVHCVCTYLQTYFRQDIICINE